MEREIRHTSKQDSYQFSYSHWAENKTFLRSSQCYWVCWQCQRKKVNHLLFTPLNQQLVALFLLHFQTSLRGGCNSWLLTAILTQDRGKQRPGSTMTSKFFLTQLSLDKSPAQVSATLKWNCFGPSYRFHSGFKFHEVSSWVVKFTVLLFLLFALSTQFQIHFTNLHLYFLLIYLSSYCREYFKAGVRIYTYICVLQKLK